MKNSIDSIEISLQKELMIKIKKVVLVTTFFITIYK